MYYCNIKALRVAYYKEHARVNTVKFEVVKMFVCHRVIDYL